ncbi:MAG: putative Tic20 family protein [Arenicella sp.]|jgi:uncharacterized Tic20 family protein
MTMVDRLPAWIFLSIALLLIALALLPIMRVVVGVDQEIGMQFFTVVMFLIGGLMSGLTAMILLVRRQPKLSWPDTVTAQPVDNGLLFHSTGLLLFSGIPLLNFLSCYWLWVRRRHISEAIDKVGQEVLNYQITMYLYLLLSLFIVFAGIGLLTTPLLLGLHLVLTIVAIGMAAQGKQFSYPLNIPIIQGRPAKIPLG